MKRKKDRTGQFVWGFIFLMFFVGLIGWGICVYKFTQCDFKAPYKAEIIYGVGTVTGLGGYFGWFNYGK